MWVGRRGSIFCSNSVFCMQVHARFLTGMQNSMEFRGNDANCTVHTDTVCNVGECLICQWALAGRMHEGG